MGAPASSNTLQLRLLGQPAWTLGLRWWPLPRKDAALLALLALHGPQSRTRAAALLWPEVSVPRAHANLRQRLFRLRQRRALLVVEHDDRLMLADGLRCDLHDPAADGVLLEALPHTSDELQAWIDDARQRWAAGTAARLACHAARLEAAGELAGAIATAERLVAAEPLQEHAWRTLMQLHAQRRDRAAALAAFERCERVLRDELGVRPSPATLALLHRVETLAAADPAPVPMGRPPPLVGRDAERAALRDAWQAGRPFLLVGEAGLGKSRLPGAFAAGQVGCVMESARAGDAQTPYGLVVRLLRALARAAQRPEALWPEGAARTELARLLPELGDAPAAPGLQALLHGAVEEALARAATVGVQGVLLDDLHHADDASLALVGSLAQPVVEAPAIDTALGDAAVPSREPRSLRWGLATRPDPRLDAARWAGGSARGVQVVLAPLQGASLQALLQAVALPGPDWPQLASALARHCGGNPLFLIETVRHLAAQGVATPPAALPLPPGVQALLAERLGRLPAAALDLARVAAVAEADFSAALACDVLQATPLALAPAWQQLQHAQVFEGERFTHDTLLDAVRSGLPQPLRAPLHAAIARSLQRHGAAAARVLHHWAAAGRAEQAARAALDAADVALRVGRLAERCALLDEAARWHEAAGDREAAFLARVQAAGAALPLHGPLAAQQRLQALHGQATAPQALVALQLQRGALALQSYDVPALCSAAATALAAAAPGSTEELRALALLAAGQAASGQGEAADAALAQLRPRLSELPALLSELPALLAGELWSHVATVEYTRGRVADCVAALEQQRRHAREAGHAEQEASALASLSGQHLTLGDGERALEQARAAAALHRRLGAAHTAALSEVNLLIALIGMYRLGEAVQVGEALGRHMQAVADGPELALIVADVRADLWLRLADPEAALRELGPDPPVGHTVRWINRLGLRAQALHTPQAWHALQAALEAAPHSTGGVRLRWQLVAAMARGTDAAGAIGEAGATDNAALQALAQLLRATQALQRGDAVTALQAARTLQALRRRARHLYVDEAQLRATVCTALEAAGLADEVRAERAAARAWVEAEVLPQLPASHRAHWRGRSELAPLWR